MSKRENVLLLILDDILNNTIEAILTLLQSSNAD